jgi:hypothetical protein
MGESIMEIRDFHIKDFIEFNDLAYKAIFERGFVDVEFNKQNWNTHIKRLVVLNGNIVRCLFDDNHMVGFYILQLHNLPWNHRTQALFTLMHLSSNYRNAKTYSSLFRDAQAMAQANNCEKIQTSDQSIQWDHTSKLNLLHGQKYNQIDISWEKKIDE